MFLNFTMKYVITVGYKLRYRSGSYRVKLSFTVVGFAFFSFANVHKFACSQPNPHNNNVKNSMLWHPVTHHFLSNVTNAPYCHIPGVGYVNCETWIWIGTGFIYSLITTTTDYNHMGTA
jgi:hypothetical protein